MTEQFSGFTMPGAESEKLRMTKQLLSAVDVRMGRLQLDIKQLMEVREHLNKLLIDPAKALAPLGGLPRG